jgi:hypothetical protein
MNRNAILLVTALCWSWLAPVILRADRVIE